MMFWIFKKAVVNGCSNQAGLVSGGDVNLPVVSRRDGDIAFVVNEERTSQLGI